MAGIGSIISLRGTWLRVLVPMVCVAGFLAILLASCGGGVTFDYVGTWEGMRKIEAKPGQDQLIINSLAMIKVQVNTDGTFDMFEGGLKKSGTVYFGSDQATLRVTRIMNQTLREYFPGGVDKYIDIALIPQPDGTVKYIDPNGFETDPVILKRDAKP
ncbi:MAG: hypothetical protein KF784_07060 [Fimbriimonadaceae bacterium]|nr:hypothetical protein [Fimbriimonadaceae bacterium]